MAFLPDIDVNGARPTGPPCQRPPCADFALGWKRTSLQTAVSRFVNCPASGPVPGCRWSSGRIFSGKAHWLGVVVDLGLSALRGADRMHAIGGISDICVPSVAGGLYRVKMAPEQPLRTLWFSNSQGRTLSRPRRSCPGSREGDRGRCVASAWDQQFDERDTTGEAGFLPDD